MRYGFGHFQLDAGERRLMRDGLPVPLTPKAFDTLLALVQHAGHAVSKDDLMRAVWPVGFVEESNLAFNISTLRKTLGEGQNGERYIETVPKLGYRFVMAVQAVEESSSHTSTSRTKRTNLPAQLTRFIGRQQEMTEVTSLVQSRRLVTLTGSGGVGKTRLALEAGAQLLDHFPNGVWLAEFAPLADETLVPATVAGVFRLSAYPGLSWVDVIINSIGEKHQLLIFDNCEHVIDASAKLADALLRACPALHILATSRAALRVPGEAVWHVPAMETPEKQQALTPEVAAGYDAIQLFAEYATLAQPAFALTQKNVAVVAGICRRLDGLPLAIEMAAAQLEFLSLREIAADLDRHFDLMASNNRMVAARHQTIRATLDWSYNLLSEPERDLFARLSVFRNGWTDEAAQAVGADAGHDVAGLLAQLTRKSLIAISPAPNHSPHHSNVRYRMLEPVRDYADEKLRSRHEHHAIQDRHLCYFLKLAEEIIDLAGPHMESWLPRVAREFDNMRAAFAHAMTCDDGGEKALRIVYAMTRYWFYTGPVDEWKEWAAQANGRGEHAPIWARARGLNAMFTYHLFCGAVTEALAVGEASLALFRQTDDRLGTAWCLESLANNANSAEVQPLAEEALRLFRELGSRDGEGRALRALGTAAYWAGDHARAALWLEQSIDVAPWGLESCMGCLYFAHPQRALAICAREVDRLFAQEAISQAPETIRIYAVLLMWDGQFAEAKRHHDIVVELVQSQRVPAQFSFACYQMPAIAMVEQALLHTEAALAWLEQAHQNAEDTHSHVVAHAARFLKAAFADADAEDDLTLHLARHCLHGFHQLDFALGTVCTLMLMASIASRRGDHDRSSKLLGVAEAHKHQVAQLALWMDGVLWMWHRDAQQTIVAPVLAAAREQLGDAEFEAAYAAGQRMSLDEAVALALNG
jgi:non-specific serine/threonine protein kinase